MISEIDYEIKVTEDKISTLSRHLNRLKSQKDNKWFLEQANRYGVAYAIMKWCKENNKLFLENLLDASMTEYVIINKGRLPTSDEINIGIFSVYKRNLNLVQYKNRTFEDSEY